MPSKSKLYNQVDSFVYVPPKCDEIKVIDCKIACKFSDDIIIHRNLLDKWKIPYKIEELEHGIWLRQKKVKKNES